MRQFSEPSVEEEFGYTEKACRGCGQTKHISFFYTHSTGKDGHRNYCKTCCLEKMKKARDPVKRKAYVKKYYKNNASHIREKSKQWREENREYAREAGRLYSKMKREKNPELARRRARGYALKRKYGITLEQYEELLAKQNHSCAVCERPASDFPTSLAVDHDHKTGRIRGLLCTHCNYRMVAKHRDGALLRKIADYIEQGTEWFVPKQKSRRKKKKNVKDGQ